MPHHMPLIGTIVAGLVIAFIMGALAHRLKVSPIAGYLLAGVIVGPFTPGFVADVGLASQLAEIGVILLMFGVGLHFSLRDLLSVRKIAIPGAIVQIGAATLMGMGLAWALGWTLLAGFVFGLALSVASTVVLLRALEHRNLVQTERGRIAVGGREGRNARQVSGRPNHDQEIPPGLAAQGGDPRLGDSPTGFSTNGSAPPFAYVPTKPGPTGKAS